MKQQSNAQSLLYWIIPPALFSLITALVYKPSLTYEFQFDDIANITKHFDIRHNSIKNLFLSGTRWVSYWLNSVYYSISKFNPFPYRAGNVTIHTINGIIIFLILYLALNSLKKKNFFKEHAWLIACTTGLLFLLHPVQTQTVSYVIQGELEGVAALLILSMSLCLLVYARAKAPAARASLIVLLFFLALISTGTKEIACISPALLLLFDWFLIAQGDLKSFRSRISLHAALASFIVGIYLWLLKPAFFTNIITLSQNARNNIGNVITHDPSSPITPWMFLFSQFKVILHYLWIFIWPFDISVEYDWMMVRGFFYPDCIFPLIGLSIIAYCVYVLLRKDKTSTLAFGALWFAVAMAPRASLIPSSELIVDYKTYTASFGYLLILGSCLAYIIANIAQKLPSVAFIKNQSWNQMAVIMVCAIPLGYATMQRNTVWRSGVEFWGNIIQKAPGKARAYNNYGVELSQKLQKYQEAIAYFQKAIAMDPKYPDPCNNLAVAYSHLGKVDEAIAALRQAITINPYSPEGYNNLASFFLQKKDTEQAQKALDIALKLRPYYGKAYYNLGRMHLEKNEPEKAFECFKHACTKADMDTDIGFATYAKISLGLEKYEDAILGFTKALELNPRYPEAKFNLANTLYLVQRYAQAATLYEQLIAENPNDDRVWYNKGETHLKMNQPQQALFCFNKSTNKDVHHLPIRIAACYEKMGNLELAKQELAKVAHNNQAPQNIRDTAIGLLNRMAKTHTS